MSNENMFPLSDLNDFVSFTKHSSSEGVLYWLGEKEFTTDIDNISMVKCHASRARLFINWWVDNFYRSPILKKTQYQFTFAKMDGDWYVINPTSQTFNRVEVIGDVSELVLNKDATCCDIVTVSNGKLDKYTITRDDQTWHFFESFSVPSNHPVIQHLTYCCFTKEEEQYINENTSN